MLCKFSGYVLSGAEELLLREALSQSQADS